MVESQRMLGAPTFPVIIRILKIDLASGPLGPLFSGAQSFNWSAAEKVSCLRSGTV